MTTHKILKNKLHEFACWLWWKTREEKWNKPLFHGFKVIRSKYIPPSTIIMGTHEYKSMLDNFISQEIKLNPEFHDNP